MSSLKTVQIEYLDLLTRIKQYALVFTILVNILRFLIKCVIVGTLFNVLITFVYPMVVLSFGQYFWTAVFFSIISYRPISQNEAYPMILKAFKNDLEEVKTRFDRLVSLNKGASDEEKNIEGVDSDT